MFEYNFRLYYLTGRKKDVKIRSSEHEIFIRRRLSAEALDVGNPIRKIEILHKVKV